MKLVFTSGSGEFLRSLVFTYYLPFNPVREYHRRFKVESNGVSLLSFYKGSPGKEFTQSGSEVSHSPGA